MTSTVSAQQGDTLDLICWRVLGTTAGGIVEEALLLNPGLADLGPTIPEGHPVTLPDPPSTVAAVLETINLWD